jgi:hypothetical protein
MSYGTNVLHSVFNLCEENARRLDHNRTEKKTIANGNEDENMTVNVKCISIIAVIGDRARAFVIASKCL